jgi:hypothetical protein
MQYQDSVASQAQAPGSPPGHMSADPTPALDLAAVGFLADAQPPFWYFVATRAATGSALRFS